MTKNTLPLVSVALITFNHERFINAAIKSVLAQVYRNIEIVISDDASNDNTLQVVKKYIDSHPEKIRLLTAEQNVGATENWFKCIQECKGKYVIGLAGDDEFLPSIISEQVTILEHDENIAICYSDAIVYNVQTQKELYLLSEKAPTKSGDIEVALQDAIYYSPTIIFRHALIPKENSFVGIRHGSDLAFFKEIMILSAPNGKIHYLPKILYKYQKHDRNITVIGKEYRREHIECIKILQIKYPLYKSLLEPAIYDFSCVGFIKSLFRANFKDAFYFLTTGLKASRGNIFLLCRAVLWGIKFYIKKKQKR